MEIQIIKVALVLIAIPAAAQVASHEQSKLNVSVAHIAAPTGRVVAKVNGTVLTDKDLVREEYAIFPYARQHGGSIPQNMEPGIRKGALEMIIFEELCYQQAQKDKMTVPPERLASSQRDFRKRFGGESEYRQFVKMEFGASQQLLTKQIKRSLLIDEFLKTNVAKKAAVSLPELRAYYENNGARFSYPESFAIQTISIMPPAKATAAQSQQARKRADDALKQAKATKTAEEFGLLAERISDDDYHVMMGDHKWVGRDRMPPAMLNAALKMKIGEMSEVIQVEQYYVIFRLNGHVRAGKSKFQEVKNDLRKEFEEKKTEQIRTALGKKLRQNAKIETL